MMNKKKIVALLPMKENSERIQGKNFRNLAGKPLFKWMLDNLLDIEELCQVIINTDARHIIEESGVAESNRVVIRDRKEELLGDLTSMNLIIQDDIDNVTADIYIMTHTTNPLLTTKTIRMALREFENNNDIDSLFSVNKIQTRFYREDASPVNHDPNKLIRTQDLEPWYEENSCLYIFTKDSFKKTGARIGVKPMMYVTPALESVDIDDSQDWVMAEALASRLV